jgi:hypothetical protein
MTPRPVEFQRGAGIVHQSYDSFAAIVRLLRRIASWFGTRKDANVERDIDAKAKKRASRDYDRV